MLFEDFGCQTVRFRGDGGCCSSLGWDISQPKALQIAETQRDPKREVSWSFFGYSVFLAGMLFTDYYSVPPEISSEVVIVHFPLISILLPSIAYFPSRLSFGYSESYLYIIVLVMCWNGTMLVRSYAIYFPPIAEFDRRSFHQLQTILWKQTLTRVTSIIIQGQPQRDLLKMKQRFRRILLARDIYSIFWLPRTIRLKPHLQNSTGHEN